MRLPFIDSDLLYRGAIVRQVWLYLLFVLSSQDYCYLKNKATFQNMYVSPRPIYSLNSLPTKKFLFEFPIEVLFNFRNFGYVSINVISISAFYYNWKLLLIRLREWKSKWKKNFLPTYLPCFWRVGRPRENIHIFKCGLTVKFEQYISA